MSDDAADDRIAALEAELADARRRRRDAIVDVVAYEFQLERLREARR